MTLEKLPESSSLDMAGSRLNCRISQRIVDEAASGVSGGSEEPLRGLLDFMVWLGVKRDVT